MTKKVVIGHVDCPVCGDKFAEVLEDKSANAYIFCMQCPRKVTQVFTRCVENSNLLKSRMRPVTVTDKTEQIAEVEKPVTVTAKKSGLSLDNL